MIVCMGEEQPIETPPPPAPEALRGKVALITGGAGGFGRAFARALLEADAVVALADIDEQAGEAAADELGCAFFALDVTDLAANSACVAAVEERFGAVDLAILNAGIESPFSLGDDFDPAAYRRAMSINLDGVVYGFHAVRPAMLRAGGGSVLAVASLAGLAAMAPQPVYGANKAAVVALARALGPAHAHEAIRVNALCPGFSDTPLIDDIREMLAAGGVPVIDPADVAAAALSVLASDASGRALAVQAGVPPWFHRFPGLPRAR